MDIPALPEAGARGRIFQAAMRLFAETGDKEVNVSELAEAAGIARGTIYNNIAEPENLFADLASSLALDMLARTEATMADLADPAERIATGLRLFVRRAHEEHHWGRFLVRFSMSNTDLRAMMQQPPAQDIRRAIATGRFKTETSKASTLLAMLTGSTLAAMNAVVLGDQTWREAGEATAEFFLRAGGIARAEAQRIAGRELAPLADASPLGRTERRKK